MARTQTFRTLMRKATPWWLHGFRAWALLQAIADQLDLLYDMVVDVVALRFPLTSQPDALPLLGGERKIPRGRAEPDATYVSRLIRWLSDHATRGGSYAMLAQLHAFWAVAPFAIWLSYRSGMLFTMALDGTVTRTAGTTLGELGPWPHWRLYFSWPSTVHADGSWASSGTWADGGVWDSDLSPEDVYDIKLVPAAWNAAHCDGTIFVISPGAEIWDYPSGIWSDPGVWGADDAVIGISVHN